MCNGARVCCVCVLVLASWVTDARPADAQTVPFTIYNTRAAWEAAAGTVTTLDFEAVAPNGSFVAFDTAQGFERFGVRIVGVSPVNAAVPYYLRIVSPTYGAAYEWGSGAVMHGPPIIQQTNLVGGPNSRISITLPRDVYAVGGDVMTMFPHAEGVYLRVRTTSGLYSLPSPLVTAARPTRVFAGIVSSEPILEIQLYSQAFPVIDNLSYSANPLTPGTPTNLRATVSGSTVNITWNRSPTGGTPSIYELLAALTPGGSPVAGLSTTSTSLQVNDVPNGTYYLRVRAANVQGQSALSSEVSVTVGASGLLTLQPAGPVTAGQGLTLSWQSTPVAASYTVAILGGPGISGPSPVASAGCCTVTLPVPSSAAPGTYRLAVSGGGMTSNAIDVQVLAASPFTLAISPTTARTGTAVNFTWTDLGLTAGLPYQLFVAPTGSTAFTPVTAAACCSLALAVPVGVTGSFDLLLRATNGRDSNIVTLHVTP